MKHTISLITMLTFTVFAAPLSAQSVIIQGDVPAERGFRSVTVTDGLEHPWSMVWLPNEDILVTERPGSLRRIRDGPGSILRQVATDYPPAGSPAGGTAGGRPPA